MANEICFRTLHLDKPWTLQTYLSAGGYAQWKKILTPKRSRSYREAAECIISTAQQAKPKLMGQSEPERAQFKTFSTVVT